MLSATGFPSSVQAGRTVFFDLPGREEMGRHPPSFPTSEMRAHPVWNSSGDLQR
jgi:hypothetical protein